MCPPLGCWERRCQRCGVGLAALLHGSSSLACPLPPSLPTHRQWHPRCTPPSAPCSSHTQVIFFVRIFADVLGRFLPRLGLLASRSPYTPLAVASLKLAGVPLFLLYLKSPKHLHSDVAVGERAAGAAHAPRCGGHAGSGWPCAAQPGSLAGPLPRLTPAHCPCFSCSLVCDDDLGEAGGTVAGVVKSAGSSRPSAAAAYLFASPFPLSLHLSHRCWEATSTQ